MGPTSEWGSYEGISCFGVGPPESPALLTATPRGGRAALETAPRGRRPASVRQESVGVKNWPRPPTMVVGRAAS